MNQSNRIATLLFLYSRKEISREEEMELEAWREQSSENEELFRELGDPEYVRRMMADLYKGREIVFDNLKVRFSNLSGAELSDADDLEEDERRNNFPEKDIAESDLSKAEFWESLLSELDLSGEETIPDKGKPHEDVEPAKIVKVGSNRIRRYLYILGSAAAAVLITMIIYPLFSGPGSGRFYASFGTSGGFKIAMNDYHRGNLAGMANISYGHNEKGEPLYIFPGKPKSPKDKTYTLETGNGHEIILKLPGGTLVWVNAESSINFSANFTQDTIYMKVDGEAYFETAPGTTKHFVITVLPTANRQLPTDWLKIETSNAKLNFTAYSNDSMIRANMISGKAIAQSGSASSAREIQAGQQVLFNKGNITVVPAADTSEILALKNGEIYLRDASIQTIMATISRWYNVEVHYSGGDIPESKLTLRVPLESKLSVIVDSLKKQGLHILLLGNSITILK